MESVAPGPAPPHPRKTTSVTPAPRLRRAHAKRDPSYPRSPRVSRRAQHPSPEPAPSAPPLRHSCAPTVLTCAPFRHSCAPFRHSCAPFRHSCAPLRHSCAPLRHSCAGRNPRAQRSPAPAQTSSGEPSVTPAFAAGISLRSMQTLRAVPSVGDIRQNRPSLDPLPDLGRQVPGGVKMLRSERPAHELILIGVISNPAVSAWQPEPINDVLSA